MTSSSADGRVKIVFKLEKDEDDYPPLDYEGLWALPVGEGLFQIDNVPFFARGIAHGDIVSAAPEQRELRFREVVRPSGHSTLRLIIYDEKDIPSVRALLQEMGCSIEQSHIPGLISVDVPPTVSLAVLRTALDEGEAQERWGYEEACLAST
ncbi:MAG TPA: DUF4265 domain-containing protein [Archangium sp.]|uniref:DUF4265 domain-containing protein n=1 Tax=Archangium sp. TaxID=1872627 RepID=UPI002E2F0FC4|nr:DUF4265 domain-containing protein [Archangium sp.]HEX5751251.1 DUF4265 domain-containing protein [Archangium sp.]